MSALVVIPTTGNEFLRTAIESILSQTYQDVTCLVVVDGPEYSDRSSEILKLYPSVKSMVLPWNTGRNGYYGHRIYAMCGGLIEHDYFFALDQDNWFDPDHIESLINLCNFQNLSWAYSLRKIYNVNKDYICDDDCESLGKYPTFVNDTQHLVDTSAYCIRKDVMIAVSNAWYSGWGADRRFYSVISHHFQNYNGSKKNSLCYRLDGNPGSVTADFFLTGNAIMKQKYPMGLPWKLI